MRRREFVAGSAAGAAFGQREPVSSGEAAALDGYAIAGRHVIVRRLPTPDFFEGMLLGNGDIGVCVVVRPDALGLHIGKNDAWDIRVSEEHAPHVVSFARLLEMWKAAGEEAKRMGQPDMLHLEKNNPFLREYTERVQESYRKPWPRPWPCGTLWLHWDPRFVRVREQRLNPARGEYRLELAVRKKGFPAVAEVRCLVNAIDNHIVIWSDGPVPVISAAYYPYVEAGSGLPAPGLDTQPETSRYGFQSIQRMPATAPDGTSGGPAPVTPQDRDIVFVASASGEWVAADLEAARRQLRAIENAPPEAVACRPGPKMFGFALTGPAPRIVLTPRAPQPIRLDVVLLTSRDDTHCRASARRKLKGLASSGTERILASHEEWWRGFWRASAVELADKELERCWYHNQYWLACCLRPGKIAPGLFGNWTAPNIGIAWHGDYHLNYNTQQIFWGTFSSNHVEQHLPYVDLVESLMPMSEAFARENLGLPGAFFPHSAYPVPSQVFAFPAPPWGYEICETPWAVQSLWWHYLYTQDRKFLESAYAPLRAAARFLAAYVSKQQDGRYHIVPTVSPENWGFTVDFRLNRNCIIDLALSEFVLEAAAEAAGILGRDAPEAELWRHLAGNLAAYPRTSGPDGEVWADVENAPPEHIYNVPVTLAPVFPGERVGLGRREECLAIARRTAQAVRLEGGNDLVLLPLVRARLGMLDLEWFKDEVRYCQLPNGVVNDRVRQTGGRYTDALSFDFMMRMGVWVENLSLPAVINECMLQSYTGVVRVFPNTAGLGKARFRGLRAVGAFLVSAAWDGAKVTSLHLKSEAGGLARVESPWPGSPVRVSELPAGTEMPYSRESEVVSFDTARGRTYVLEAYTQDSRARAKGSAAAQSSHSPAAAETPSEV